MSATEHIVEAYFRYKLKCFTMHDVKVAGGNNRQFDLLAYQVESGEQYHVEIAVTHEASWAPTLEKLQKRFEIKFFGAPAERERPGRDFINGRVYGEEINATYRSVGFDPSNVQRIWVCWTVAKADQSKLDSFLQGYSKKKKLGERAIKVWSFRDTILKELIAEIGKSNYDDPLLRTISLVRQFDVQREKAGV